MFGTWVSSRPDLQLRLPGRHDQHEQLPGGGSTLEKQSETVSVPVAFVRRTLERGVFTLSGAIGSRWSWDVYYMHGQSRMFENALNNADFPNLLNAENAVLVTPANVGKSGLPVGAPTCLRPTLNPALPNPGRRTRAVNR